MKERPILFNGEMVRALLAGRKTVTRRLVTVPWAGGGRCAPYEPYWVESDGRLLCADEYGQYHDAERAMVSPCGMPGARLYVRESYAPRYFDNGAHAYMADWDGKAADVVPEPKWTPSIHMPRAAARLLLDVVSVRVERLQDITAADAVAEGADSLLDAKHPLRNRVYEEHGEAGADGDLYAGAVDCFAVLWDSLAPEGSRWSDNPWVWRVEFSRVST